MRKMGRGQRDGKTQAGFHDFEKALGAIQQLLALLLNPFYTSIAGCNLEIASPLTMILDCGPGVPAGSRDDVVQVDGEWVRQGQHPSQLHQPRACPDPALDQYNMDGCWLNTVG
jgi:hypothetical protein